MDTPAPSTESGAGDAQPEHADVRAEAKKWREDDRDARSDAEPATPAPSRLRSHISFDRPAHGSSTLLGRTCR